MTFLSWHYGVINEQFATFLRVFLHPNQIHYWRSLQTYDTIETLTARFLYKMQYILQSRHAHIFLQFSMRSNAQKNCLKTMLNFNERYLIKARDNTANDRTRQSIIKKTGKTLQKRFIVILIGQNCKDTQFTITVDVM